MGEAPRLQSYEDWKHCITVLCGIPLSAAYIEARIAALDDRGAYETQRFVRIWGDVHLDRVKAWFRQARAELGSESAA